jgi:hypothetical protein
MDDCLSIVLEVEGLAVAEATGPKTSEMPAGAEAPGSDESSGNSYGMGCRMEGCGKENSDVITHPPTRHTSLIAATSTGFTLWPSRYPMALSSPAAYPNRSPPDPPSTLRVVWKTSGMCACTQCPRRSVTHLLFISRLIASRLRRSTLPGPYLLLPLFFLRARRLHQLITTRGLRPCRPLTRLRARGLCHRQPLHFPCNGQAVVHLISR